MFWGCSKHTDREESVEVQQLSNQNNNNPKSCGIEWGGREGGRGGKEMYLQL